MFGRKKKDVNIDATEREIRMFQLVRELGTGLMRGKLELKDGVVDVLAIVHYDKEMDRTVPMAVIMTPEVAIHFTDESGESLIDGRL